jgi:hypothetical protein
MCPVSCEQIQPPQEQADALPWGALATACAALSTSSRSNWWLSRRLSARPHAQLHPVWLRARQRKGLRVFALGQR